VEPETTVSYFLENARLVAILTDGGGAVVESGLHLEVKEGRSYQSSRCSGVTAGCGTLRYSCYFNPAGSEPGDSMVGIGAQMVVAGTLSTGGWIEFRGAGELWYDENSCLYGEFEDMPAILVEERPDKPASDGEKSDFDVDAWAERVRGLEPKPPLEFERAAAGRRVEDEDDDDE
jgi:hypothetical protein